MNNYSKLTFKIQSKIRKLVKIFDQDLKESNKKFITNMVTGTLSSKSVLISEISRSIRTKTESVRYVNKRLLRNIHNFNNQQELQDTYQKNIDHKINNDTIFCVDNSDITKNTKHSKFEYIDTVRDGSTKVLKLGYYVTSITALDSKNKNPIPIYNKVFSLKEKAINSINIETENALRQSFKHHKNKGLYVFDRGYDDLKLIQFMEEYQTNFIIRIKNNRNFIYKGKSLNIQDIASQYKGKYKLDFYNKTLAKVSYIPVELPKIKNKKFLLIVVYKKNSDPMYLLTNLTNDNPKISLAIAKAYILRWKIEEYFKFIKQSFDLENIRLRKLKSINLMIFILQLSTYIIAEISHSNYELTKISLMRISQPLFRNRNVKFSYYQIANGISKLLNSLKIYKKQQIDRLGKNKIQLEFRFYYGSLMA